MANLQEMVAYLDEVLKTDEIKDFPGAHNGLQLQNDGRIDRVFSAVDASLAVVKEVSRVPNSLLIVHHGMFWQGVQNISGAFYEKLKFAMEGNLAIYSSHLPLDVHPVHGNNVLLAKKLGLEGIEPILVKNGIPSGVSGKWMGRLDEICEIITKAVGREIVVCKGGGEDIRRVAVITGGAGSAVAEVAELGVDLFVTGEGSHWTFVESEEKRINTVYAGHYSTEVFGVDSISKDLAEHFALEAEFVRRSEGL